MKKAKISFLLIIIFSILFPSWLVSAEEPENSWQDEMIYFIMIDRFNNGDPNNDFEVNLNDPRSYHGGDFKGIIEKLDYINDMGFTAIWLTPIFKNEPKGYHGYWTEDFYDVEEHFGTLDEFKQLVEEAHKRDIKVILDLVVNHTGYQSPWLNDPDKQDWFHEAKPISNWDNQDEVENGQLAGLPDLAQENPEVKKYLLDMAKWWIEETDIDGYRLDTVKHVPKWFWEEFSREVKSVKKDFFLIGEVWHDNPQYVADYAKTGIDSFVDYPFYNEASRIFSNSDQMVGRLHAVWSRNTTLYPNPNLLGNFLDNHDNSRFSRLVTEKGQDPTVRLKQALTYMYTVPGIPIIYYGTEIAMDGGEDPDNRRFMEFTDHELVDYISKLSSIRQQYPALSSGNFEILVDQGGMTVYKRSLNNEDLVIVINNTSQDQQVELSSEKLGQDKQLRPLLSEGIILADNSTYQLNLPKEGSEIYILENAESKINIIPAVIGTTIVVFLALFIIIKRKRAATNN